MNANVDPKNVLNENVEQITDAELENLLLILDRRNAGKPPISADFMFSDEEDDDKELIIHNR